MTFGVRSCINLSPWKSGDSNAEKAGKKVIRGPKAAIMTTGVCSFHRLFKTVGNKVCNLHQN